MAEAEKIMPGDIPDWVKEAEAQIQRGDAFPAGEIKPEVTIKFGKGLVGDPFTSKNGKELVEVKIPNADRNDHSPWASFVISPKMIHDNKYGKGVWMKLPEDGTTRISKPLLIGTRPDGKRIWEKDVQEVPNTELKAMMESYKTRDKSSVLEDLKDRKVETDRQPEKPEPEKARKQEMEK